VVGQAQPDEAAAHLTDRNSVIGHTVRHSLTYGINQESRHRFRYQSIRSRLRQKDIQVLNHPRANLLVAGPEDSGGISSKPQR
jgi:hypothetical protein